MCFPSCTSGRRGLLSVKSRLLPLRFSLHNGTVKNTEASLRHLRNAGRGSAVGVKAVDSKTLEVPVSYFLSLMYFPTFYPVNQVFFESLADGTFGTSPETTLSNAVNRVSIVEDVVKDGSVATYTAVPPQFATGPDGSDFSADQEMFKDVCADDTEKAASYYEAAKAELGTDTFEFELLVEDQTETQNVAAVIKDQVEKALPGVTLNIKVEPKKQRVADIQDEKLSPPAFRRYASTCGDCHCSGL